MSEPDTDTDTATSTAVSAETPATEDDTRRYSPRQVIKILIGLMLAMLTAMLTNTIVSTALPTIIGELGGQDKLSWVASATLLSMTASTPLWGKLSDVWGRKLLFQIALVIFVASSVAAGFAQDIYWLIGARFFQGLGMGGVAALTQIILGDVVEPRERGRYAGFLGGVFAVATVAGPLLGGFIVDSPLGWRWCFFITVPLAVVAFAVIQRLLKFTSTASEKGRIDWWGATFIVAAASCVMLLLSLGGSEFDWNSAPTYLFSVAAIVFAALAVLTERRAANPIIPPALFGNHTFVIAALASLLIGVAMFGTMIYLPQYLQIVKGLSPTESGLMTLPMVGGTLIASVSSGFLVSWTGKWKIYPVCGMLLVFAGYVVLSQLEVHSSLVHVGFGVGLIGLGLGLSMQILILATQNALSATYLASATSAVSFFRNLGGAMGVAVFGAIMTNTLNNELAAIGSGGSAAPDLDTAATGAPGAIQALPGEVRELVLTAFSDAMHNVFLTGIPVALTGFVLVLFFRQQRLRSSRSAET